MLIVSLKNLNKNKSITLSETPVVVLDNSEYSVTVETDASISFISPTVMVGDIEVPVEFNSITEKKNKIYKSIDGSFFENAIFLNYFGECEISISVGDYRKTYIVQVNVTGYKATVAKEMLVFLSDNSEDILQTCYSRSKIGFSSKEGRERKILKLNVLKNTVHSIENLLPSFLSDKKIEIKHSLTHNSNKPEVVDDSSIDWLSENIDELFLTNSTDYTLKINRTHYQVKIPNSVTHFDTDLKENRVLHQFALSSLQYLNELRDSLENQTRNITEDTEYLEYVKFDQVIKGMISPILVNQIKDIDLLINRVIKLHKFFTKVIPAKNLKKAMPLQTPFSLRHRHYATAFNEISKFYQASDAEKSNSEFLLGLRNLSQLFELCCLFSIIKYFRKISNQKATSWTNQSYQWSGKRTDNFNVLANEIIFDNEHYEYTVLYEKRFFSLNNSDTTLQNDNLIRVDKKNNYYIPDFVIKVLNKSSNEYYFVILDAKFSRNTRMKVSPDNKAPNVLQSTYNKYATNLRAYKDGGVVNLTRYVGVIFGLSKYESEQKRICLFSDNHDIDGVAPIFPFSAADFISFSDENTTIDELLSRYIQQ